MTEEFWGRLGYAVIQGYGLTETTSIVSVNHPFRLGKGSIGKVLAGREVKLAAGRRNPGPRQRRGRRILDRARTAADQRRTKAGTGLEISASSMPQGNLYFKGRKKDVIVTPAGMNVYPEDLEAALRRQPEVKDCVVIALPRDGNAEPCAVLILRDRNVDPEPVVRRANETLAEYQRMRNWFVWPDEDFPRTSTQKPRSNAILQVVLVAGWGISAAGEFSVKSVGRIDYARHRQIRRRSSASEADLETDLNLSSLDRVELLGALEDRYQVDLSETSFAAVKTVGDLERMLQGKLPPRVKYHYPAWVQRWPTTWDRLIVHYLLLASGGISAGMAAN